jgi:hypothetical protein
MTKLERINSFIDMYGMEDRLKVTEHEEVPMMAPYQVEHKVGEDEHNFYMCKTLDAASDCVNRIIFDLPMNATPANGTT